MEYTYATSYVCIKITYVLYLARFRDMMDYWSNFSCRKGVSLFSAIVPEFSIANLVSRNQKRLSIA